MTALIREQTEGKNKISVHRLAKEINDANVAAHTACFVNFKTISKLKNGDPKVGLTKNMWIALTTAFPELKHRPVFVIPGVIELLVGAPKVVFMLGAKARPEERRNDISHWDSLSLAELITHCSKQERHHQFDIRYVLWRTPVRPRNLPAEPWYRVLEDDDASVVSIGSPLASLSSEIMLARMFNVEPFVLPHFRMGTQAPFCFVWRPMVAKGFQSAFGLTPEGLELLDAKVAGEAGSEGTGDSSDRSKAAMVAKVAADVRNDRASAFVLE